MTIAKKRPKLSPNHIIAKTPMDSSAGLEKRLRWKAPKPKSKFF